MDHLDAEKMHAVERYLLGDLSVSEADEFERHFFDCPQCSEESRVLTIFQENARTVFAREDRAPIPIVPNPRRGLTARLLAAAVLGALIIGLLAGYLFFKGS
jgi:hypothetical protein